MTLPKEGDDLSKLDRGDALPADDTPAPADDTPAPKEEIPAEPTEPVDKAAPPAKTPVAPAKPDIKIPKERLDQEIGKRRTLEQEIARLKEELDAMKAAPRTPAAPAKPAETPPDPKTVVGTEEWFDAQEDAYQNAVLDGKHEDARRLRKEIRNAEQAIFEQKVEERSQRAVRQVDIQKEFDSAVQALETKFPIFDPNHKSYDEDMVQAVIGAQAAILKRDPKKLPGAALIEAAAKLNYKLEAEPAPAADDTPAAEEEEVHSELEDEAPAAPAKPPAKPAAPPAKPPAQPARGGSGNPAPAGDKAPRLTESSVGKMSATDRARARGDFIG